MARETWRESDIHRIAGGMALLAAVPIVGKAKSTFRSGTRRRARAASKIWELRAATSPARLLRDQGEKYDGARETLASVYGWFGEGLETLDLKRAEELLAELA